MENSSSSSSPSSSSSSSPSQNSDDGDSLSLAGGDESSSRKKHLSGVAANTAFKNYQYFTKQSGVDYKSSSQLIFDVLMQMIEVSFLFCIFLNFYCFKYFVKFHIFELK